MKKNVTIRIEEKVVKEAQEVGLNVSRICENALKEAIARLKGKFSDSQNCNDKNILNNREPTITCRRVGGRLPGESLRKLIHLANPWVREDSVARPDPGTETKPTRSCAMTPKVEVGLVRMKRPFHGMQGQASACECSPEAGGSPLS